MKIESTRRGFLAGAAGVAGAMASPAPAPVTGEDDLILGVATYSFREFSRKMMISGVKALRVKHLSVKEFHLLYRSTPEELAKGRDEIAKAGLIILSAGNNNIQKDTDEDVEFYFKYAKGFGCPMLIIAPTVKTMPRIEKFVKKYDIKVALHNHGPEDKHFPSPESALKVMKDMDPRVGVCVDVGHTTRTGADVTESIQMAGSRLLDVHIKDLRDLMGKDSQCDVGDGAMPVVKIFKTLKAMNYKGGVMLEYEINAENPLPGMQKSFSYMRGVLAGLRG
jgi:sugar phosphate isomerase/epimerase